MKHTKKLLVFILITIILVVWVGLVKGQKKMDLVLKQLIPFDDVRNESSFAVGEEIAIVNGKLFSLNEHGKMAMTKELPEPSKKPTGWKQETIPYTRIALSKGRKYFAIIRNYYVSGDKDVNQLVLADVMGNTLFSTDAPYGFDTSVWVSDKGDLAISWSGDGIDYGRFDLYNARGELIKKNIKVTEEETIGWGWSGSFSEDGNYFLVYRCPIWSQIIKGYEKSLLVLYNLNGDELWRIEVPEARFSKAKMSPNNQYILADRLEFREGITSAYGDFIKATYWDMYDINGNKLWSVPRVGGEIKFSHDSRYVVIGCIGGIEAFESSTGKKLWSYDDVEREEPRVSFLEFDISSDDNRIIVATRKEAFTREISELYRDENDKTPWQFFMFNKDGQLVMRKDYTGQMVKSICFTKNDKYVQVKFVRSVGYFEIIE